MFASTTDKSSSLSGTQSKEAQFSRLLGATGKGDSHSDGKESGNQFLGGGDNGGKSSGGHGKSLGKFLITHYTVALESDPLYANDPKVAAPGLPGQKFRKRFLLGKTGTQMQGSGLTESGKYIHYNPGRGTFGEGLGGAKGHPSPWKTCAVDPRVIPLGSQIDIGIYQSRSPFLANDTGGAIKGNHIDVFVGGIPYSEALRLGKKHSEVWVHGGKLGPGSGPGKKPRPGSGPSAKNDGAAKPQKGTQGAGQDKPHKGGGAAGGSDPVSLARSFVQDPPVRSSSLKGKLPHFQAAGGETNNCADFVSSVLLTTGKIGSHQINVNNFYSALKKEGWKSRPRAKSEPGDVLFLTGFHHVELVSAAAGSQLIGSNNRGKSYQVICETPGTSGTFMYKPANGDKPAGASPSGGRAGTTSGGASPSGGGAGATGQSDGADQKNEEKNIRDQLLSKAASHLGAPYCWTAQGPSQFDCSGFSWYVLHTDMKLTKDVRTTAAGLAHAPFTTAVSSPKKGDLVFYAGGNGIAHVTIATGSGDQTIGASGGGPKTKGNDPKAKVKYTSWSNDTRSKSFGSIGGLIKKYIAAQQKKSA